MLDLGLLGLTNPWLLTALISLPALWWLLRMIPPAPQADPLPGDPLPARAWSRRSETSARTPPWLLLLRLLLAALLILALAGPVLNPEPELTGEGPLVLVVDDGWAAAPGWDQRPRTLERFAARAAARQPRGRPARHRARPDGARRCAAERRRRGAHRLELGAQALAGRPRGRPGAAAGGGARRRRDRLAERRRRRRARRTREAAPALPSELMRLGPLQVFAEPAAQRALLLLPPDPPTSAWWSPAGAPSRRRGAAA